ncbi:hypothetical protein NJBCHELONAE_46350 [Mycobacteroides chelonae]|uniref:hypothetical protein n=1 Tax=Mycobacteroides chelonae TaxID=1774 RepID=UPI0021DDC5A8|nr:hypothetical protein [Mycobacteroides chelonae]GLE59322.1 hypothetical protein NJBCHELONAE_46350 [Mycobacteroides chelonae]
MSTGRVLVDSDETVEVTRVGWHSPLEQQPTACPEAVDYLSFLRYRLVDGPAEAHDADAILILQPGNYGGPSSLDCLANTVLRRGVEEGLAVEVWALARRSAGLEDPAGVRAAFAAGAPDIAFDYYFSGAVVDGSVFEGIKANRDVPFLAEFGFVRVIRDMHETLERFVPDPEVRRQKVFIGGHSGGAIVAAAFGAWDFDGIPGHDMCRGFVALDTPVDCDFGLRTHPVLRVVGWPVRSLADALYPHVVRGLRSGVLPRISGGSVALMSYALRVYATYAYLSPEVQSNLNERITTSLAAGTYHRVWRILTRLIFSTGVRQVLTGRPRLRFTSAAEFGMWLGAGVSPVGVGGISVGSLDGPQGSRSFPVPAWAWRVPVVRGLVGFLLGEKPLAGPTDPEHLYRWKSAVGSGQSAEMAASASAFAGHAAVCFEPYHASRYTIDQAFVMAGARCGDLASIQHERGMRAKPLLSLFAGLVPFAPHLPFVNVGEAHVIRGYTHVDVGFAVSRPDGVPEPLADLITSFLLRHTTSVDNRGGMDEPGRAPGFKLSR